MERLTEFWKEQNTYLAYIYDEELDDGGIGNIPLDANKVDKIIQKLGYYEDLEEQGKLLILPCKECTTVYEIVDDCNFYGECHTKQLCKECDYRDLHIEPTILSLSEIVLKRHCFDKTIFLSEEKANEAFEKLK